MYSTLNYNQLMVIFLKSNLIEYNNLRIGMCQRIFKTSIENNYF